VIALSFRSSAPPNNSLMLTRRAGSFVWLVQLAGVVRNPTMLAGFRRAA